MARKSRIEAEKGADAAAKPKARKPAAKRKAPGVTPPTAPAPITEPTDDEIRIRAYFIAERRMQLSLPGDSAHDWIEARRQLIEEAGPASS